MADKSVTLHVTCVAFSLTAWLLFEHRELNLLLHRIDPVHQHPHAIAQAVGLPRALADDLARGFVVGVAVVSVAC